jgi:uncharacterized protein
MRRISIKFNLIFAMLITLTISACGKSEKIHTIAGSSEYPIIAWSTLSPLDWDGTKLLETVDLSNMQDNDPRAFDLLKSVRAQWNNAPVVKSLDGHAITIKGYPVPLDGDANFIKEFLLVPYFGACIHTPPPPSNQVIHVRLSGLPIPYNSMDSFTDATGAIAVRGILKVVHSSSALGEAGYQMQAQVSSPIEETAATTERSTN